MATIFEAPTPQLEHWTFPSSVTGLEQSRSSTPSKATRQSEKVPVEIKQVLGFGMKREPEPIHCQQYLSDEEGLSPVEHDDTLSVDYSDEYDDVEFDEDLPELAITYEYTAKACTKALIVSIKPVRPKMVDLPSPSEKSSASFNNNSKPPSPRDSPIEPTPLLESQGRRSMSSSYSQTRRYSSVPLMESAAEARAVSAVFLPSSVVSSQHSFLNSDPFQTPMLPTRTPSTHSRLRSLSKTISLAKLTSRKSVEAVKSPTTPVKTPVKQKEASPRTKLVARGANEREPVLQLPDFPDEPNKRASKVPLSPYPTGKPWPERTDSKEKQSRLKKRKSLVFG